MNHNFIIGPTDTDSISFCKSDMSSFTEEERKQLIKEINDISPEFMDWADDGYYVSCVALKAKNYVLFDGQKKTTKGSAFKTQTKEPAMKEMMQELIDVMLQDNDSIRLLSIYKKYVKEAMNVTDIHRWCSKKNVSRKVLDCEGYTEQDIADKKIRRNETVIWDAIKHIEGIQEGDKLYLYPTILGHQTIPGGVSEKTGKPLKDKVKEITGLKLETEWKQDEDKLKLVERVYATVKIFQSILDMEQFLDYSKVSNKKLLENLIVE